MATTSEPGPYRNEHGVNLALVLILHLGLGVFWLFALGGIVSLVFGEVGGIIWGLSAAVTWIVEAVRIVRAHYEPGRTWGLTFLWWLKSFLAPFFLGFEVLRVVSGYDVGSEGPSTHLSASPPSPPPPAAEPPAPRNDLTARLDDFARRLTGLEQELGELRRLAQTQAPAAESPILRTPVPPPAPPIPAPPAARRPIQAPPAPKPPVQAPRPPRPPVAEQPPSGPRVWEREIPWEDLFGAKALAWAGGVVTLLGIVFFFVLAVNRGWIRPAERVGLGALASLLVFGAGLWLRRAYGPAYSALSAAGAGIAGGYVTLLAATALYDLVPREIALLLAAGIAAVATATALAWSSELIAGLGLIGATLAPAAIALQDGEWSSIGTAFVALMFAATATVAVVARWQPLLAVGLVASLPQVAGLVADAGVTDWDVVAVAAAFWLLYLAAAVALQLRLELETLASLPTTLVLVGGVLAGLSSVHLFDGSDEGLMLLAVAVGEALTAAALFPRMRDRDLSALLGAVSLALGAVAVAILVSGPALTIAWAAEAAVLAWLARRVDEVRYQVAAFAYLAAALVHAVFWEAPVDQLYTVTDSPANGVAAVVAVALAASVFARYAWPWESEKPFRGVFVVVAPLLDAFRGSQALWRSLSGWTGALAALYAASLGVLQTAQWLGPDDAGKAFDWGHVAVAALWALVALAVIVLGDVRSYSEVRIGGLLWLPAVPLQVVVFDSTLEPDARTAAFLVLAGAAAALGALGRRIDEPGCHMAALLYLAPVLVHAMFVAAPLDQLYREADDPAAGIISVIALVVATALVAYNLRLSAAESPDLYRAFYSYRLVWRSIAGWTAALASLYAASLSVLQLGQWLADGSVRSAFEWSHVALTGLWGLAALGTLALGLARRSLQVRVGGLAWLVAVLVEAVFFDLSLDGDPRGYAFLVAGAALAAGALLDRLSIPEAPAFAIVTGFVLASIGLDVAGLLELTSGDWEGYALLALAAVYCGIALVVHRRDRDLSTVLWAPALVVAGYAASMLLSGTWLVLAWAAAASALAALVARSDERRLQLASFGFLAFALAHTLAIEAPPADLFEANRHPEDGVPALLFALAAAAALGVISRGRPDLLSERPTDYEQWSHWLRAKQPTWRRVAYGASAILAIYAGSLAILGLAEALGNASVATDFQRGHSGVSAFWGVIGLVALYLGLRRGLSWLRLAGFALFGLALAKLFLYDLAFLSSITRALSFLAVGAVLLIGGFFVQRLGAERSAPAS